MNHTGVSLKSVLTEPVADVALGRKAGSRCRTCISLFESSCSLTQGTHVHCSTKYAF